MPGLRGRENSVCIVTPPLGGQEKRQRWWREPLPLPIMAVCRLCLYVCLVLCTAILHPEAFEKKLYWQSARPTFLAQGMWNTFGCWDTMSSSSTSRQGQRQEGGGRGGKNRKGVGDAEMDAARKELFRMEWRKEAKTKSGKVFWWL